SAASRARRGRVGRGHRLDVPCLDSARVGSADRRVGEEARTRGAMRPDETLKRRRALLRPARPRMHAARLELLARGRWLPEDEPRGRIELLRRLTSRAAVGPADPYAW